MNWLSTYEQEKIIIYRTASGQSENFLYILIEIMYYFFKTLDYFGVRVNKGNVVI